MLPWARLMFGLGLLVGLDLLLAAARLPFPVPAAEWPLGPVLLRWAALRESWEERRADA